jgi:hypothetical protein
VSATSYYAEVTTDASGHGVVLFQTSPATAIQQFHIVAENPVDLNEDVGVILGLPAGVQTPARTPTPVIPLHLPTTRETPLVPATTTAAQATLPPVPPVTSETPVPSLATVPTTIPVGETPVEAIPLPAAIGIAAAAIGLLRAGTSRRGA